MAAILCIVVSLVGLTSLVPAPAFALLPDPPTAPAPTPDPTPDPTAPTDNGSLANDAQCSGNASQCVQAGCPTTPITTAAGTIECPDASTHDIFAKYLNPFIKLLAAVTSLAVIVGLIVGGIQYSSSGGDPQKVAIAKKHIRNSIIAFVAFIFLYAILKFLLPGGITTG